MAYLIWFYIMMSIFMGVAMYIDIKKDYKFKKDALPIALIVTAFWPFLMVLLIGGHLISKWKHKGNKK